MNYYPPMNHYMPPQNPPNRFIYVKQNFTPNPPPSRVLLNPHFKKTVYVNPEFKPPKIHVNPNVLKSFAKPVIEKATTVISTHHKLVRVYNNSTPRKRRESLHTKYKIVRSGAASTPKTNKFKLDKRKSITKRKYVYVNRFLSMNVVAKNVLIKKNSNLCKPGFVNINGILYKKSPNSLKRAEAVSPRTQSMSKKTPTKYKLVTVPKPRTQSKYRLVRKDSKRQSVVKRFKLIRSKKAVKSPSQLRKCNIPCQIYRKYGRCPRMDAGKCFRVHNPDQIVLCTRFLQGACRDERCPLSHKVSAEKMPTCKYFLEGLCSKDNCPYLHVKISAKADICRDFLEGFCKSGAECNKRHQFLCPDFEKEKKCVKRRCPYPHGNTVRKNRKVVNVLAKKCSAQREARKEEEKNRYYDDLDKEGGVQVVGVTRDRPKLGDLPAFIPFS